MWEEVDEAIREKIITKEKTDAKQHFEYLLLFWLFAVVVWVLLLQTASSLPQSMVVVFSMLYAAIIIAIVIASYSGIAHTVEMIHMARYMMKTTCGKRIEITRKDKSDLKPGYYITIMKNGKESLPIPVDKSKYEALYMGGMVVVLSVDQSDETSMRIYSPSQLMI